MNLLGGIAMRKFGFCLIFLIGLIVNIQAQSIFEVQTDQQWQSTGVTISSGDEVLILGWGMWNINTGGSPPILQLYGPGGNGHPADATHLVGDVSDYSLVGRVGTNEFFVGAKYYHQSLPYSGELELAVNDWVSGYNDNSGTLMAVIITNPPNSTIFNELGQPAEILLGQNYPNPFNPSTKIPYTINSANIVQINIYDVNGKIVKTIVNNIKQPGEYFETWDGTDKDGNIVPSGQYFYQLTVGGTKSYTKKGLLIK